MLCLTEANASSAPPQSDPELFEFDGEMFVAFYDLPSRRFRAVREAFLSREFVAAASDLRISARYLEIERQRAYPSIAEGLCAVVAQMERMSDSIDEPQLTIRQLDPLFARSHWLLAQHFLYRGVISRSAERYQAASRYLIAAVHHMERAAIWSNARLTPKLARTIDELRTLAVRLESSPGKRWVKQNRPLLRANKMLVELGAHINMLVELPNLDVAPVQPSPVQACQRTSTLKETPRD